MNELENRSNADFTVYTNSEENIENNNDWKQSEIKQILNYYFSFIVQMWNIDDIIN